MCKYFFFFQPLVWFPTDKWQRQDLLNTCLLRHMALATNYQMPISQPFHILYKFTWFCQINAEGVDTLHGSERNELITLLKLYSFAWPSHSDAPQLHDIQLGRGVKEWVDKDGCRRTRGDSGSKAETSGAGHLYFRDSEDKIRPSCGPIECDEGWARFLFKAAPKSCCIK